MMKFLLKLNRTMLILLLLVAANVQSKEDVLDDVKSVYIYNFLSFVQWPAKPSLDDGDYQICIANNDSILNKIEAVVSGEVVNGRSINVQSLSNAASCHLIYLDDISALDSKQLSKFKESGALLVSDANGFVSSGGMVGFETRGRKVRVAMNLTELERAGFKVSSKLLRVVRIER